MESVQTNADWTFLSKKPFGFLMSLQTAFAFIAFLLPFFVFNFAGIGFLHSCALTLFLMSLTINMLHVLGFNRRVISITNGINLFLPCTLILFGVSVLFMFLFGFSTLMSLIAFFDSFRFTARFIIVYALLSAACAAETMVCFRLAVLLFRAAPNSQLMALVTVIIDGEGTSRLEGSGPQFSSGGAPASDHPTGPNAV